MSRRSIPSEFEHLSDSEAIPWTTLMRITKRNEKKMSPFEAFTDAAIEIASKEVTKKTPNDTTIRLGVEACLTRGRIAEALLLSSNSKSVQVLSLRAIALFVLSDSPGLKETLTAIEGTFVDEPDPADLVRLSTVRVLQAAAERDTNVIMCVMEFDNLLETYPEQVENPLTETMFTLYVVGSLLYEVGQAKRAERIADTLEDMAEAKRHRMCLALVENLRGNICNFLGNFNAAEKHYLRVKKISDELSFGLGTAMALNNLGTLRLNTLRPEEALGFFSESLSLMEMEVGQAVCLANLGEIATILGMYKDAENYLKEAVEIEARTHKGLVEIYAWYTILLSRLERTKEAEEYLEKAREIAEVTEKPIRKGSYLYAKGVYEASRNRYEKAVSTFEELLKLSKANSIFEMLVRAKLELSRTYLGIHSESRDPEHLSKAAYHLDDLSQIAKEQGLQHLYARVLLLRSDFLALAGQDLEAKAHLEKAQSIASFAEDERLLEEAKGKLKALTTLKNVAQSIDEKAFVKAFDRVAGFKPAGPLREIPRPILQAILVLDRISGLTEFVHHFGAKPEMDSTIVSGFLSAISAFTGELLGDTGLLRSINHEGSTIMLEHTPHRIFAMIVEKETFDIRYTLHEFAKRFNATYEPTTGKDGVDTSEYSGAEVLVSEMFSTKPTTEAG
ncbi:MAG: tetratricopeptide repeat protein [Candidatus Thorarchaeota archaeon]|nr:tetratricopeptide repeat protein [Candidatus Thorarchaeota archaeon]